LSTRNKDAATGPARRAGHCSPSTNIRTAAEAETVKDVKDEEEKEEEEGV
jgi:hypothetical protein